MHRSKKNQPDIFAVLIDFIICYIKRISDLIDLAALEAQLAFKSLVLIAVLIFLLSSAVTVCWLSVLVLIFFYLLSLHFSLLATSMMIVGINLVVIGLIFFMIYRIKPYLFFPSTVEQLNHSVISSTELQHEKITTKN